MNRVAPIFAAFGALVLATSAQAWEADTTHAGLTEQSAVSSKLHERLLDQFGAKLGLYTPLTIPPKDAPALFEVIGQLNPTHGYAPDGRGQQSAVAWIVAGSVVADMPVAAARNHFFDPSSGAGLSIGGNLPGSFAGKRAALAHVDDDGAIPAPGWITSNDNPLSVDGFHEQYRKAVTSRTQGERDRHLAGALLAAGAVLHVLQDMGSPSHVRNDFGAHLGSLSDDDTDVGSRFERITALAYGRLGVPAPARTVSAVKLGDLFATDKGGGLAHWTASRFFSAGTLPKAIELDVGARAAEIGIKLASSLGLPNPAPLASGLDLIRAARSGGATLAGADGTCIARYAVANRHLSWSIDDDCALEQAGVILPEVSAYSAGALDFLFRGTLALSKRDGGGVVVSAGDSALGAGNVTVLWDDATGVRTELVAMTSTTGGTVGATLATAKKLPAGTARVAALFDGVDANGERVVAAGLLDLASSDTPFGAE